MSLWRQAIAKSIFCWNDKTMRNNWLSESHHVIGDDVTEISNVKSVKAASQIGDMCAVPVYNVYASCGFGAQNDAE
ncbi:hypothetical protein AB4506_07920, partial [Vibrio sp. 10N.222.46.A3]